MEDEILTIEETASLLKVSTATIRRWIKRGRIKAFRAGREYRIRKMDIEELFKRQIWNKN